MNDRYILVITSTDDYHPSFGTVRLDAASAFEDLQAEYNNRLKENSSNIEESDIDETNYEAFIRYSDTGEAINMYVQTITEE